MTNNPYCLFKPESAAAAAIKNIIFNLEVAKPPNDVTTQQLFQEIQMKLEPAMKKAGNNTVINRILHLFSLYLFFF